MTISIALPARARAPLTASGIHIDRGGRTVLSGVDMTVSPASRWGVQSVGTLGVAEQEMPATDDRTVGDVIDVELADARAALRALNEGAQAGRRAPRCGRGVRRGPGCCGSAGRLGQRANRPPIALYTGTCA